MRVSLNPTNPSAGLTESPARLLAPRLRGAAGRGRVAAAQGRRGSRTTGRRRRRPNLHRANAENAAGQIRAESQVRMNILIPFIVDFFAKSNKLQRDHSRALSTPAHRNAIYLLSVCASTFSSSHELCSFLKSDAITASVCWRIRKRGYDIRRYVQGWSEVHVIYFWQHN